MAHGQSGRDKQAVICHVLPQTRPQVRQGLEGAAGRSTLHGNPSFSTRALLQALRQSGNLQQALVTYQHQASRAGGSWAASQPRPMLVRRQSAANAMQVWFGSRVVVLLVDPELGRLANRNPNRHAYPHLGDLKSKADNASFFSSITTARECERIYCYVKSAWPVCPCANEPVSFTTWVPAVQPSQCTHGAAQTPPQS